MHVCVICNKKSPRGTTLPFPPSPRGVKDIMVTQDTSSSLCSERRDEYVWPSKNRRSGTVTTKNKENNKKTDITRRRPDGGVKRIKEVT